MWESLQNNADWGCFKTPILQEILRIQNPRQVELCVFESHTFVPISWMCKKQTSVSHSSTESEIISLDAGLRLDGIPALYLWDLIVAVLHGNTNQNDQERGDPSKSPTRKKIHGKINDPGNVGFISSNVHSSRHLGNTSQNHDRTGRPVVCRDKNHVRHQSRVVINVLDNVDLVPSNVQFSHQEALLYVFEDNEAVIKMIIKGRSPTLRHVSRTHRVALDWLFDRINLDSQIQIKYIDTKHQLADILTKRKFHT